MRYCLLIGSLMIAACASNSGDPSVFSGAVPTVMNEIDKFGQVSRSSCINLDRLTYKIIPVSPVIAMLATESGETLKLMEIEACEVFEPKDLQPNNHEDPIQSSSGGFFSFRHGVNLRDGFSYADSIINRSKKICRGERVFRINTGSSETCKLGFTYNVTRQQANLFLDKLIAEGKFNPN